MIIYPAIDIKEGRCVRLLQGRFDDVTVYGDDPVQMAQRWVSSGANWLHIVDLDGARGGTSNNRNIILEIVKKFPVSVQTGGGIRTMEDIEPGKRRCFPRYTGNGGGQKPCARTGSTDEISRKDCRWY